MKKTLMKKNQMKKIRKYIFFLYVKMTNNYYEKNKEKLQNRAPNKYQNLTEEEKD